MEYFSESQLHKYERILDQLKAEFEKHEELKRELEKENDNIIVSQLANNTIITKVSHVNVKVFSSLIELFSLYQGELKSDYHKLLNYNNCKFYLIEVYITKTLMQKVRNLKWLLNIVIRSQNEVISQTVGLTSNIPILEVIPVDANIINCVIEASLVLQSSEKCMVIKLDSVDMDISFHFETFKEKQNYESKINKILQITRCYNENRNFPDFINQQIIEYKLPCDVDTHYFVQTILKNSYHKLDIELFSELDNENTKEFVLQLSSGLARHILIYNKEDKNLTVKSNARDLCLLKKYFCQQFHPKITSNIDSVEAIG